MSTFYLEYQTMKTEITIEKGCSELLLDKIKYEKIVIITDELINQIYGERWQGIPHIVVPRGEKAKNLKIYEHVCQKLSSFNADKNTALVAFGGGAIGDLTGFVASTYKRGLPFIQVPTTLLAQVDASIGGKNAINLSDVKNQIGTIYQPTQILIDSNLLLTLSKREFNNGMAEIIKYAILFDEEMFIQLETQNYQIDDLIKRSVKYKGSVTTADEHDQGMRAVLNFGHTFGHIIEQLSTFKLKHGEAIAWGMLYETSDFTLRKRIKKILKTHQLLKPHPFQPTDLIAYLNQDKKVRNQEITIVDLKKIGSYELIKKNINQLSKEVTDEHFW